MKLTETEKKINLTIMFYFWFKSAEYHDVHKSAAIQSLTKFMTSEFNWQRKKAADRILTFFREQGMNDNALIELWGFIMEKE
jgi:hypothetical protein